MLLRFGILVIKAPSFDLRDVPHAIHLYQDVILVAKIFGNTFPFLFASDVGDRHLRIFLIEGYCFVRVIYQPFFHNELLKCPIFIPIAMHVNPKFMLDV